MHQTWKIKKTTNLEDILSQHSIPNILMIYFREYEYCFNPFVLLILTIDFFFFAGK